MADDATNPDAVEHDDFDVPLATPDVPPTPGTPTTLATPTPTAQDQQQADATAGAFPADLTTALRREKLPTVPGETIEAAYSRLSDHLYRKNSAMHLSVKEMRDAERARAAEVAGLRQSLEPMLRSWYQQQRQAQIEQEAAQIPDKDSPEYQVWLMEETLRRDDERRQQELESKQQQELTEQEREYQQQLAAIDQSGYTKVADGLGLTQGTTADPEFQVAYDVYSEAAVVAARNYFPNAPDDKIQEFVALSQQLDIRRAEMNGMDIRDVMKGRYNALIESLVRRGVVTRAQAAAAVAGNGHEDSKQPQHQQQQARTPAPPPKTVAQTVREDAAAAQRRGPNAVAANTRPSGMGGQVPDPSTMDEDDFVEATLAGLLGNEEQRAAPFRRQR